MRYGGKEKLFTPHLLILRLLFEENYGYYD